MWGDEATIAARVQEHRDAGADHVCIQVLTDDPRAFPAEQWRALRAGPHLRSIASVSLRVAARTKHSDATKHSDGVSLYGRQP